MKMCSGVLATATLLSGAMTANAQQVTVTGCPVSGAVQGCIMIRGADNVTYNITDSRQKPEFGKNAIRVTGVTSKTASYCAQGVVLTNVSWSYTNQPCR
jgi:hypothetical protein